MSDARVDTSRLHRVGRQEAGGDPDHGDVDRRDPGGWTVGCRPRRGAVRHARGGRGSRPSPGGDRTPGAEQRRHGGRGRRPHRDGPRGVVQRGRALPHGLDLQGPDRGATPVPGRPRRDLAGGHGRTRTRGHPSGQRHDLEPVRRPRRGAFPPEPARTDAPHLRQQRDGPHPHGGRRTRRGERAHGGTAGRRAERGPSDLVADRGLFRRRDPRGRPHLDVGVPGTGRRRIRSRARGGAGGLLDRCARHVDAPRDGTPAGHDLGGEGAGLEEHGSLQGRHAARADGHRPHQGRAAARHAGRPQDGNDRRDHQRRRLHLPSRRGRARHHGRVRQGLGAFGPGARGDDRPDLPRNLRLLPVQPGHPGGSGPPTAPTPATACGSCAPTRRPRRSTS